MKVADLGRFSGMPSAALKTEALRHAGNSLKKKGPENIRALVYGGEELDLKKRHTNGTTYLGARICVRNQLDENSPVID